MIQDNLLDKVDDRDVEFSLVSNPATNQAAHKLQRAFRLYTQWKCLHRMAVMRTSLYALITGYQVRRFMKLATTKALIKDI